MVPTQHGSARLRRNVAGPPNEPGRGQDAPDVQWAAQVASTFGLIEALVAACAVAGNRSVRFTLARLRASSHIRAERTGTYRAGGSEIRSPAEV
jgi:hypothetical protein